MGDQEKLNEKENQLNLKDYLPEDKKKELEEILSFWERIKKQWEKKKKEFWENNRNYKDFPKLLWYKRKIKYREKKFLWKMSGIEREKFIEEYLHDDIVYSNSTDLTRKEKIRGARQTFASKICAAVFRIWRTPPRFSCALSSNPRPARILLTESRRRRYRQISGKNGNNDSIRWGKPDTGERRKHDWLKCCDFIIVISNLKFSIINNDWSF